ncbi:PstS family phosphate ABC transporter substrate-binding protein [Dehalococcoides mccartyi]|nr:PstS family phosphate ABC transporter substrate-binding protein [Dehalococcoides mccartyi]
MIQKKTRSYSKLVYVVSALLIVAVVAACGSNDKETNPTSSSGSSRAATNATQPTATTASKSASSGASGEITVDGSSTVFPISQAVAEEFRKANPKVQIPVGISGSGGGFKRFTVGEIDIANASRAIKDSEAKKAAENGVEFIELRVAWDGLSIITSKSNDFVECLTTEELKLIWDRSSEVDNWNQVRSSFPDKKLRLYGPDTDSGTFDYFTDEINGEEDRSRSDYTASSDDNVLVLGIAGDGASLGYFGYAYYAENTDKLNLIAVDSGNGCIAPSTATINDGSYSPLSRPLFIYVNVASLARPEVRAFVEFYMNEGGALAEEVGYVRLSDAEYAANLQLIRNPELAVIVDEPVVMGPYTGEITVDGSSTVFPISQAVAEEFRKANPKVQIPVGISGSGGGFKRFTVGEIDIADASRAIKDSEAKKAAENGVEFIELRVAWDGLSIITSKSNDFVECLTTEELKLIWDRSSEVDNWNQVRSSFPDKKLRLYGPDTDSGTFDYFTDEINGEEDRSRSDYTASSDDNVLVLGIAGDGASLGYFGYAYYAENTDKLNLIAVDSGNGCIAPSTATINDGSYSPLSRPLFIYVNVASLARPEVRAFVEFYMNEGGALAEEVGYVRLSDAEYAANLQLIRSK